MQRAAGAEPLHDRRVGAGDGQGGVDGVEDRLPVGVEVPVAMSGVRVPPGDHEDLLAALDEVLDEAAARREVGDVELVDHRRDHEQRAGPHRRGLRRVLDQLEHLGAQYHRAGRDGQVAADLERVRSDHRRHPRRRREITDQVAQARDNVAAAGVDERLPRRGADQRVVARGERGDDVVEGELQAGAVPPVQVRVRSTARAVSAPAR